MRFMSYLVQGRESYGLVTPRGLVDLSRRLGAPYPDLQALIAADALSQAAQFADAPADFQESDVTALMPIKAPAHLWCLALNYVEHHSEMESIGRKQELPAKPALFARYADSFTAHNAPLEMPTQSDQFDYEGELAVVIGKPGRDVSEADAMDHVAGYTIVNDGSVRDWQFHTRQITPGKNFYHSGAIGPYFVTKDEIADPHALSIVTRLNGTVLQDGNSRDMVHKIPAFVSYVSRILPLVAGDILATGTPSGVGVSRQPQVWMKAGDTIEIAIEGLGTLRNSVQSA